MFRQMGREVEESVAAAHSQHIEMTNNVSSDDNKGLYKVYHATQADQVPRDNKLDYTSVRTTLPWVPYL